MSSKSEIIAKKLDTQEGRKELGRAMADFVKQRMKRNFRPIEQIPTTKCPNCSVEYYDVHPDNGCDLGIVQNVSDS